MLALQVNLLATHTSGLNHNWNVHTVAPLAVPRALLAMGPGLCSRWAPGSARDGLLATPRLPRHVPWGVQRWTGSIVPIMQRPKCIFYNPKLAHGRHCYTCLCLQQPKKKHVRFVIRFYCTHKLFLYQARILLIAVFNNTHTVIRVLLTHTDVWLLGPRRIIDIGWKIYW